ncbi:D-alanine--D-alanine ligase [Zavarzinia aquatilis]|uniref:D-alanine--D-alanine ligase n=1 Tax=Zavarzinia aquatilis TaxID=2211142 RepID=A0A317ECT5_9PROT|nr:D-alanine--D-alanine ligase [Zavarzinia aquatilis]PWR24729.1 D-alanine--D-alanine ligase [Zavarzinia aquatilis]
MSAALHVAVLKGGLSTEREVSLNSGAACAQALRNAGFRVTEIDVGADLALRLSEVKPDVVFNALHGRFGEDGCVQGVLELMRIPYTHSGVRASAVAMDKPATKVVLAACGLPLAEGVATTAGEAAAGHLMAPPYVVKPTNEGSSVGVHIVRPGDNRYPQGLTEGWTADKPVLVERFIPGRELTVGVMHDRALAVTEILPATDFYDYEAKYAAGGSRHVVPAQLPEGVTEKAMALAVAAHRALGCRGVSRIDFRFDDASGELIVLEVNTQPGMTGTSLVPEQAAHCGMSFEALVTWMVEDASCDR